LKNSLPKPDNPSEFTPRELKSACHQLKWLGITIRGTTHVSTTTIKQIKIKNMKTKKQNGKTESKKANGNGGATEKVGVIEKKNYLMISPKEIIVDETKNARIVYDDIEELMLSIVENGLRNPLKVRKVNGKIHLREGFRRMRAVKLAFEKGLNIARVPVILDERQLSEEEVTLEFLINNDGKPLYNVRTV
jgi:hypothetical protein